MPNLARHHQIIGRQAMIRRVANVLFLLGLFPWALLFFLSIMLFEAPGSETSPLTVGLSYSIAAYPLLVVVGFFASSGFWRMRDDRHWRRHLAFLPLLSILATCLFFLAILQFCDGRFACSA